MKLAFFFSLFFIMGVAAAYEIIEEQYAVLEGGGQVSGFRFARRHLRYPERYVGRYAGRADGTGGLSACPTRQAYGNRPVMVQTASFP